MAYRWKPSKAQRKAFAQRMQDPDERAAYEDRKQEKREKFLQSLDSPSDQNPQYVPTQIQHDYCVFDRSQIRDNEDEIACSIVASAFACSEKVDHYYIHLVNEQIRRKPI